MKLSDLKSAQQLRAEEHDRDPALAAEWRRTALARAVAIRLVAFRDEHRLSQKALAVRLGMEQPQIARMERGDVNPRLETLARISGELGIEFNINIHPTVRSASLVKKRGLDAPLASFDADGSSVSVSAA